jgi:dipicolinate synthase subunit A
MGARVTVAARKREDLALARAQGCDTVQINGKEALFSLGRGFAAIFNTVPCCLFDEAVLSRLSHETLMIDLASAPGGVDANAAGMLGIRVVWALSLPGKYAPITAGEIIAQTILAYLSEGE